MQHLIHRAGSAEDLAAFLSGKEASEALAKARGILVQVFWNGVEAKAVEALASAIQSRAPGAVVVGASSGGNIADGAIQSEGIVVSVSCFSSSLVSPVFAEVEQGREREAGLRLSASLERIPDLKAALLLAPPLNIDVSALLRGMDEASPTLVLFGGGAQGELSGSSVLTGSGTSARGVAAVAFAGRDLHVELNCLFDWQPLGPSVRLSEVERGCIRSIDGKPAFEHYRKTLGIESSEDLFLAEFPLLFERKGQLMARNPLSLEADGGIRITADIDEGESARLGYLDVGALDDSVHRAVGALSAFAPEAVFIYSCICRRYALQEETEMETLPFQGIAPCAGLFTSGEFGRLGGRLEVLNSSEIVVAMREGEASPRRAAVEMALPLASRQSGGRHARMTSHLFRFIATLTETLGKEVVERRKAEEQAKAMADEKARLLRELQHRVKNSMIIISSIASLEAAESKNPDTRVALLKLEARIQALASLYDLLYTTESIEEIELSEYLRRVVDSAARSFGAGARGIAIGCDITRARMDVKRAISLGLIINELVTDSIKYAFPHGREGRIEVSLRKEGGELILKVRDDGIGLAPDFDESSGFGLGLVKSLASQLGAGYSAGNEGGAVFEIRMPL